MKSIIDILSIQSIKTPHKTLMLSNESNNITYRQFYDQVNLITKELMRYNIKSKDRVLLLIGNNIYFYIAYFSILNCGAIAVPVSPNINRNKLNYIINDCSPYLIVKEDIRYKSKKISAINKIEIKYTKSKYKKFNYKIPTSNIKKRHSRKRLISANDIAMIIYTSGSTGESKGVVITHENIIFSANAILNYLNIKPSDRILNILPPSFDYGLYQVILAILKNSSIHLLSNIVFGDQLLLALQKEKINILPITPYIASIIIKSSSKYKTNNMITKITSTGDILSEQHIKSLIEIFPNSIIYSMYGLTECKRVSYLTPNLIKEKPYCVGKPMKGVKTTIVDENLVEVPRNTEGQLLVEGKNIARGYWNDKILTKKVFVKLKNESRALLTNDIFTMDNNGFLYFKGRTEGFIKSGGHRINLREIYKIMYANENIINILLVPYQDEKYGTRIKAYIVPRTYYESLENDIKKFILGKIDHQFLMPSNFVFLSEIPKSDNYKNYFELSMEEKCLASTEKLKAT